MAPLRLELKHIWRERFKAAVAHGPPRELMARPVGRIPREALPFAQLHLWSSQDRTNGGHYRRQGALGGAVWCPLGGWRALQHTWV